MKDIKSVFSTNLRNKLAARNKTQTQLAKYLNVSQTSVSLWCNGEVLPRSTMINRIADFFMCSADELTTDHSKTVEFAPEDIIAEELRENPRLFKLMMYASRLSDNELDELIARVKK